MLAGGTAAIGMQERLIGRALVAQPGGELAEDQTTLQSRAPLRRGL